MTYNEIIARLRYYADHTQDGEFGTPVKTTLREAADAIEKLSAPPITYDDRPLWPRSDWDEY